MIVKFFKTLTIMALLTNQIIGQAAPKNKAILIIDIQKDFTGEKARMPVSASQAKEMIYNINRIVDKTDQGDVEIIYIGNEYSRWDILNIFRNFAAIKGTEGTKMDPRLHVVNSNYFPKRRGNAFSNPKLDSFLKEKNINDLYLCGLKADACVYQTAKGALKRNYHTNVVTDCIAATSDKIRIKMITKYKKLGAVNITNEQFK